MSDLGGIGPSGLGASGSHPHHPHQKPIDNKAVSLQVQGQLQGLLDEMKAEYNNHHMESKPKQEQDGFMKIWKDKFDEMEKKFIGQGKPFKNTKDMNTWLQGNGFGYTKDFNVKGILGIQMLLAKVKNSAPSPASSDTSGVQPTLSPAERDAIIKQTIDQIQQITSKDHKNKKRGVNQAVALWDQLNKEVGETNLFPPPQNKNFMDYMHKTYPGFTHNIHHAEAVAKKRGDSKAYDHAFNNVLLTEQQVKQKKDQQTEGYD